MLTFQLQLVCRIMQSLSGGLCLLKQASWLVVTGLDALACQAIC